MIKNLGGGGGTGTAAQSAQTLGMYALGNTTGQSSNSSIDARSFSISAVNGISAGLSAGVLILSGGGGGAGGVGLSAGTQSVSTGTVAFANSNGITFGMSGSNQVTASHNGLTSQSAQAASASNGSFAFQTLGFSNANNVTFGSSAGSIITASVAAQSNQTEGRYAIGNTTGQSSSSTFDARTMSISGAGAVSVGYSGNALVISAAAGAQSAQSLGIYGISQTTGQSSSSTYDARSLSFVGAGIISIGQSGGSVQISAPAAVDFTQLSVGFSTGGNTAGNTGLVTGQMILAGGNGITLSGSTNGGSMTVTISGGAGGGGVALSAGTQSVSTGTVAFSNSNGITFGMSGSNTITASHNGLTSQSNQAASASNGSFAFQTLGFSNANGVTFGTSAGSIVTASVAAGGAAGSISAGTTSVALGQVVFSNSNNVSFGLNGSTVTATATIAQSNQTIGLYATGNTTQNSSTTFDARTAGTWNGLGAMTVGFSNGSIQLSAPATSSLSATGQVSISVNGSTISIGVPNVGTETNGYNPYADQQLQMTQLGNGSLNFDPQSFPTIAFDRLIFPIFNTNASNSSGSHSISFYFGIYSRNASTLSLVGSTSRSTAVTHSGTAGSYSLYSNLRNFSIGSTATITAGKYWMAFASSTSSGGANGSYSNMAVNNGYFSNSAQSGTYAYAAVFGSSANATNQLTLGQGFYTAATAGIPSSVAFSQINGTAQNAGNQQAVMFASSTV